MALWVCGGEAGCGTKYAVGLFRCPRCHNTAFYEDGDPMGKISRHAGASVAMPDADVDAAPEAISDPELTEAAEPLDVTEHMAGPAEPVTEPEGGEESSPGSSSSASTEKPQTNSEPSSKPTRSRARGTGSRSSRSRTETDSSAPSTATDGQKTDGADDARS